LQIRGACAACAPGSAPTCIKRKKGVISEIKPSGFEEFGE
jgi:hypothetical protein